MTAAQSLPSTTEPRSYRGLRVGVVGLGVEGQDAVRFLHGEGAAAIIVSDQKPAERLREQTQTLAGIPFRLESGGNDVSIAERVDALFVSQGVADDLPLLVAARARGVPITATTRLFLQRCPAPVIGITGSAGKTTTTALVGEIFAAAGRSAFVGGNIGTDLLSRLAEIDAASTVVLEISHTQLMRTDRSPQLAAVLNITPNHLDQFTWNEYVDLKRHLVRHQRGEDIVVLPTDDATARSLAADTPALLHRFGVDAHRGPGAYTAAGRVVWHDGSQAHEVLPISAIRLRGAHNLQNVLAAVSIAGASGASPEAAAKAIAAFGRVPHRLEEIATVDGALYVNDSIATAPERTIAALRSYDAPAVLLLGGRDKRLPLETLADEIAHKARAVIGFGEAGDTFLAPLRGAAAAGSPILRRAERLEEAVTAAREEARPGDVVLLSPAGTSFDAYDDYAARGRHFAALVRAWSPSRDEERADAGR